ncbi:hypothetical protein J1614_010719 [Plenodomus biglobosus]|nr:hypothetical protein J1614_010719 [Plenodomus biglobosus]
MRAISDSTGNDKTPEERLQNYAEVLIRADIQEYVRAIYALWTQGCKMLKKDQQLLQPPIGLAEAYLQSTTEFRLFLLYRLAM